MSCRFQEYTWQVAHRGEAVPLQVRGSQQLQQGVQQQQRPRKARTDSSGSGRGELIVCLSVLSCWTQDFMLFVSIESSGCETLILRMKWRASMLAGTYIWYRLEAVQVRRSRLPEAVHGPQQFEEAREEPLEGGAGPGRGYGGRVFENFERKLKFFSVRAADNFNCSGSPSQRVRGLPAIRGEYSLSENFLVFSFLESKKLFSKYFSQGGFILGRGCRDEARWPALPLLGLDGWRCRLFQQSHHICQYHRQHHPYQCPHTHGHVHRWSGGLLALPRLHDQPTPVQESSRGAGVPQRWQFRLWSSILWQLGSIGGKL